jgi:tellurite methyltransferase
MLVCRLPSSIGIEEQVHVVNGRRCRLPDGSERYLVDERLLMALTGQLRGELLDPLKTTIVQNQACIHRRHRLQFGREDEAWHST